MSSSSQPAALDSDTLLRLVETGSLESLVASTKNDAKAHQLMNAKIHKPIGQKFMDIQLDGKTPLMLASMRGDKNMVKYLCEEFGARPMETDDAGETALSLAVLKDQVHIMKYLIEERHADPSHENELGQDCLQLAAKHGYLEIARYLLSEGLCDVYHVDHRGWAALHYAADSGSLGILEAIVALTHPSKPVDVNMRTNEGDTPLYLAARHGYMEIVKHLIDSEPNLEIDATNVFNEDAITAALAIENKEMADYMKDAIAARKSRANKRDRPSIMHARFGRAIDMMKNASHWVVERLMALYAWLMMR